MQYNNGVRTGSADEEEREGGNGNSGLCDILWFILVGAGAGAGVKEKLVWKWDV